MGNKYGLPLAALLLAALAVSCEKIHREDPAYASEEIVLDASPEATKGFLSGDGLNVNGTQFQMYDYLSGYQGTIIDPSGTPHTNGNEYKYFENTLTFKQDAANWQWLFGDVNAPTSYRWTRTGTHHFYGWLLEDKTSTDPDAGNLKSSTFFDDYTPGEKTLSLAKTFTAAGPQYDFLYSDVVAKDVADGIPASVNVPMNHLFGALGITLQNTSKTNVVVYSVRLVNFPNSHAETLTWDTNGGVSLGGGNPTVSGAADAFWPNKISSDITLYNIEHAQGNKTYDAFTGALMGDNLNYRMCWPMTQAALKPTVTGTGVDGNPVYSAESPLVEVDAKVGSTSRMIYKMRFPNAVDDSPAITAGKKTQLNVSFADKQIQLSFKTLPWDYEEFPMSFEEDAISATQLKFIENTYVDGGKLTDANGKHTVIQLTSGSQPAWVARGRFSVYTPVNGRLSVGLSGDIDSFIVTLESGNTYTGNGHDYILIDPSRDGGAVTLGVKPKGVPASGKKLFLHFAVINNNRDTDADSEINRDKYVITIP